MTAPAGQRQQPAGASPSETVQLSVDWLGPSPKRDWLGRRHDPHRLNPVTPGHNQPAEVIHLSVDQLVALPDRLTLMTAEQRAEAGRLAMATWGYLGSGLRRGDDWLAWILLTTGAGLPLQHPLRRGGIGDDAAGLLGVQIGPWLSPMIVGKRLLVLSCEQLRGRAASIEAFGQPRALASVPTPPANWLRLMGFHRLHFPPGHFQLDLSRTISWLKVGPILQRQGAPAFEASRTGIGVNAAMADRTARQQGFFSANSD
ncbi:MAG: hypothetical protein LBV30_01875 [Propionibacteriaceae bacterium]|jgi:hypothetical protein|nr:hypothetical protein [Propionibacteriaceae bacterium]